MHTPNIIDIEASGFGDKSYPIEVGVVLDNGEKYCTLISPEANWTHWDMGAEKIHQLSRNELLSHGKSIQEVVVQLNELLKKKTLYTDGWVVDKPWLIKLFHAAGRPMLFNVSPLEIILTEAQMAIWHKTKENILASTELVRHRASNDAWIVQETFKQTLKELAGRHSE